MGLDNDDDFSDFVAHRIIPSSPSAPASSNVDFFSNNDIPSTAAPSTLSPQKSSNSSIDLFNTNPPTNSNIDLFSSPSANSNVDLFNIPNSGATPAATDLFQLNNQNDFLSNKTTSGNSSTDNKLASNMELLDFTGSSNSKTMIPSMTMPNLNMVCAYLTTKKIDFNVYLPRY